MNFNSKKTDQCACKCNFWQNVKFDEKEESDQEFVLDFETAEEENYEKEQYEKEVLSLPYWVNDFETAKNYIYNLQSILYANAQANKTISAMFPFLEDFDNITKEILLHYSDLFNEIMDKRNEEFDHE